MENEQGAQRCDDHQGHLDRLHPESGRSCRDKSSKGRNFGLEAKQTNLDTANMYDCDKV